MIDRIWNAYAAVYELGDEGLDALIGCAAYTRWLAADMSDEYLASAHPFELEMIRSDLEGVLEKFDWLLGNA